MKSLSSLNIVCPLCREGLLESIEEISCARCERKWPLKDGIPHFIDSNRYWGEPGISQEVAQNINEEARKRNWHEVLKEHALLAVRQNYTFINDLSRARWHQLLKLPGNSVVLDLGAGTGTISQALSEHYGQIFSIERVEERVEFMRIRFKQEKCENITIIKSDIDQIPFPENYFDLIVLNGVLEWLPFSKPQDNPRKAQIGYLKALKKLLKPGGTIYIGIENRYNYSLFLGAPDPHISIKYVTILPRFISHLICKIKTGDWYRPYLYSSAGYRRLLKDAGYLDVDIFASLPSYNEPRQIISLMNQSAEFQEWIWVSKNRLSNFAKRIMIRLDLLKYFGYAYIIFARKRES